MLGAEVRNGIGNHLVSELRHIGSISYTKKISTSYTLYIFITKKKAKGEKEKRTKNDLRVVLFGAKEIGGENNGKILRIHRIHLRSKGNLQRRR